MTFKTVTRIRKLYNTHCFECQKQITELLPGDVVIILNSYPRYFHSRCIRNILSAHIVETLNREADIDQKAKGR